MQPFQRAKLLAGLSRKHRALVELVAPPFAIAPQTRWYAAEAKRTEVQKEVEIPTLSCMLADHRRR